MQVIYSRCAGLDVHKKSVTLCAWITQDNGKAAKHFEQFGTGAEVAHLKMTLEAEGGLGDLAVVNLVWNDFVPELSQRLQDAFTKGELTINLRAEAEPKALQQAVREAVEHSFSTRPYLRADWQHCEFFKPGKPQPTHRVDAAE